MDRQKMPPDGEGYPCQARPSELAKGLQFVVSNLPYYMYFVQSTHRLPAHFPSVPVYLATARISAVFAKLQYAVNQYKPVHGYTTAAKKKSRSKVRSRKIPYCGVERYGKHIYIYAWNQACSANNNKEKAGLLS